MNQQVGVIDDAQLSNCLESGGVVALVQVTTAEVAHPGTRSEMVTIRTSLEQSIHGEAGETVELRRYTSGGNTVLAVGKTYVVAGASSTRWAPAYALVGYIEVPPGREGESVEAHRQAVERLLGAP